MRKDRFLYSDKEIDSIVISKNKIKDKDGSAIAPKREDVVKSEDIVELFSNLDKEIHTSGEQMYTKKQLLELLTSKKF